MTDTPPAAGQSCIGSAEPAPGRERLTYRGVDRRGTGRCGQSTLSRAELVEQVRRWYNAGWRSLTVRTTGGTDVAGIERNADGQRIWWAES
jgi:hypothetical protein